MPLYISKSLSHEHKHAAKIYRILSTAVLPQKRMFSYFAKQIIAKKIFILFCKHDAQGGLHLLPS